MLLNKWKESRKIEPAVPKYFYSMHDKKLLVKKNHNNKKSDYGKVKKKKK